MYTEKEWKKAYKHLIKILKGNIDLQQEYLYYYASYNIPVSDLLSVKTPYKLKFKDKLRRHQKEIGLDFFDEVDWHTNLKQTSKSKLSMDDLSDFTYYLTIKENFILSTYINLQLKQIPIVGVMKAPFSERAVSSSYGAFMQKIRRKFKRYVEGDLPINSYYVLSSPYYDLIKYTLNYEQFRQAEVFREARRTYNDFYPPNYTLVSNNIVYKFTNFILGKSTARTVNMFVLRYQDDVPFLDRTFEILSKYSNYETLKKKFWYYYNQNLFHKTVVEIIKEDWAFYPIKAQVNQAYKEYIEKELRVYEQRITFTR